MPMKLPMRTVTRVALAALIVDCGSNDGPVGSDAAPLDPPTPIQCSPSDPPARFVSEVAPPGSVASGSAVTASVTFANCSGTTWNATSAHDPSGYKLGFASPRDDARWGVTRIPLGFDVPSGTKITIPIAAQAPAPGAHSWGWAIVHEGVAWLSQSSPLHTITVTGNAPPQPSSNVLCNGVTVDLTGATSASAALQSCIDSATPGATLELPPGTYRITSEVAIAKPITLKTRGATGDACLSPNGPPCAVLRADENLLAPRGIVRIGATSSVALDHVAIDGNRAKRLGSVAAQRCAQGDTGWGFNASTPSCEGCSFLASASVNALCGSGFEWIGDQATIAGSLFRSNGDHVANMMWADGLTLLRSNGAKVQSNQFLDNSDVGLIVGGARDAIITGNLISQSAQGAYAGLMLDNFNGTTPGDFTGAVVQSNDIHCGSLKCDFGIQLGPHPWYLSGNTLGGTVTQNVVDGAKINVNVEGGGTVAAPLVLGGNTIGSAPASAAFNCGTRTTTAFNVSPDSKVVLSSGPQPTGAFAFHGCQ